MLLLLWVSIIGRISVVVGANSYSRDDFPTGFVFGSGSSAYQVEGAANIDGRTPSIWDTFTHAGKIHGDTGDVACDEYHKYKEDVKLMAETGLEAYRFSISWSRLIPNGRGPVNPKGLEYYNNLINELVIHGIQPHITLHHSNFPQALENKYGGWVSPQMVKDFTAFADVCFREFGDRVKHWTTMNELNVFVILGYDAGFAPPCRCSPTFGVHCLEGNSSTEPYIAIHHMLLAHASAFRLYEKKYKVKQHGFIGINIYSVGFSPLTESTKDEIATQRANDFFLGWILDPLIFGDYPNIMKTKAGSRIPTFTSIESKKIKGAFDFIGLNYYMSAYITDLSISLKLESRDFFTDAAIMFACMNFFYLFIFFPLMPYGLVGVLEYIKQHYGNPAIYIHENGQRSQRNSSLEDWSRVSYLNAYIGSLLDAIRNGSDVRGYFQWSFLDVFELTDGYGSSFGLYYVDLEDSNLRRIPKLSASWGGVMGSSVDPLGLEEDVSPRHLEVLKKRPFMGSPKMGLLKACPPLTLTMLAWNCRGLGSPDAINELVGLVKMWKPECVFLLETKCMRKIMEKLSKKLKFENCYSLYKEKKVFGTNLEQIILECGYPWLFIGDLKKSQRKQRSLVAGTSKENDYFKRFRIRMLCGRRNNKASFGQMHKSIESLKDELRDIQVREDMGGDPNFIRPNITSSYNEDILAVFFREEIRETVISLVQECFIKGQVPTVLNKTLIVLIPKDHVHKVKKHKGKNGLMLVKIDLKKAYAYLEWSFLDVGRIQCIKLSKAVLAVSHLLYADDMLLSCKANNINAANLNNSLSKYSMWFGQQSNPDKSNIFFSPRTKSVIRKKVNVILGFKEMGARVVYLGNALLFSHKRAKEYDKVKGRVHLHLEGWQSKLLSITGKATLLRRFWWGVDPRKDRFLALKSWTTLCSPKEDGNELKPLAKENKDVSCWNCVADLRFKDGSHLLAFWSKWGGQMDSWNCGSVFQHRHLQVLLVGSLLQQGRLRSPLEVELEALNWATSFAEAKN
ncbi:hypothetical protein FNV43_RR05678 [Rhamnella rubrinervis]|uniref:Beta-glucosidase n=1 Tax=Rhamnella rubrinervis TaxID=2594499 RepID=A0A8K0HMK7_9ROSA|nr:hypothetical protein FNV43_RR05678 [Rhamnella rubrinervis]